MNKDITDSETLSPEEQQVFNTVLEILRAKDKDSSKVDHKHTLSYLSLSFYDIKCMRIKCTGNTMFVSIPNYLNYIVILYKLSGIVIEKDRWLKIPIEDIKDIYELSGIILEVYAYCYSKSSNEIFGCCSKYVECSDAKACVHEQEDWAKGCNYRKNLINGKIFYGVNANNKSNPV